MYVIEEVVWDILNHLGMEKIPAKQVNKKLLQMICKENELFLSEEAFNYIIEK